MDLLSPRSLQDLCIDVLAENEDILWSRKDKSLLSVRPIVEWKDPEVFLHRQFADRLLEVFSNKRKLTDGILSTFTQKNVHLENVKISFGRYITEDGLQVLSHHKLISLDINRCAMNICTVLKCIGNKSNESLQHLALPRFRPLQFLEGWPHDDDLRGQSVIKTLSRFNCLKSVDVSDRDLSNTVLTILGKSLQHVENLNLSGNDEITDISPLKDCQKTLKSLSLYRLNDMTAESAMATFVTLTGLTYLNVSLSTAMPFDHEYDGISLFHGKKVFTADMLLQMPDILPNLMCLDLSGRTVRSELALSQFLEAHQSLQMLVLWGSDACHFKSLQDYRPRLTVGGDATLEQYAAVLRHWTRTGQHQGIPEQYSQLDFALLKLNRDLETKPFPPCGDDHLVQVVLGMLPTHSSPYIYRNECFLGGQCLKTVYWLLEKRIITHLEPETKQHLLRFCHRARQEHPETTKKRAVKIMETLG